MIYPKSHEQQCDSWLITFSLINTTQSNPWCQISRVITKQEGDYKTVGRWQNKQLTPPVGLHKEMWLRKELKSDWWYFGDLWMSMCLDIVLLLEYSLARLLRRHYIFL